MTDTIQSLAGELAEALISDTRTTTGEMFYKLADGSPEWMTGAIQAAHDGMMPDDTRYAMIRETAYRMADADDSEIEDPHEAVDGLVDVYTAELTRWLSSHHLRLAYCDEAMAEYGAPRDDDNGMLRLIMMGQFAEYREIWSQLAACLAEEIELREAGETAA